MNLHVLPKNMVLEMHALKRLEIINCNLTRLRPDMEKLNMLWYVELRYNALKNFKLTSGNGSTLLTCSFHIIVLINIMQRLYGNIQI